MNKRIIREKRTISVMINMYCRKHHGETDGLCDSCKQLNDYSVEKTDDCKFGENKPVCENCTVHCYNKSMRDKIRDVMRYAGPRMIYTHPWLALLHTFNKLTFRIGKNQN